MNKNTDWTVAKDRAALTETRITHEINMLGQRMTWLVTSQAFLFAAWVQLIKSADTTTCTLNPSTKPLLYVIPTIGFGVSIAAWSGISAATRMADRLVIDRASFDAVLDLTEMSPRPENLWTRFAGRVPTILLPPLFAMAWITVIVHYLFPADSSLVTVVLAGLVVVLFQAWTTRQKEKNNIKQAEAKSCTLKAELAKLQLELLNRPNANNTTTAPPVDNASVVQ